MADLHFWNGMSRTLGFEIRSETEIVGRSGIRHSFKSLALDERSKRILVVADALEPKMAALVHSDCAGNIADWHLLTVRPETFSLAKFLLKITEVSGTTRIDTNDAFKSMETWFKEHPLQQANKEIKSPNNQFDFVNALKINGWAGFEAILPFLSASIQSELSIFDQAMMIVKELARLDWGHLAQPMEAGIS